MIFLIIPSGTASAEKGIQWNVSVLNLLTKGNVKICIYFRHIISGRFIVCYSILNRFYILYKLYSKQTLPLERTCRLGSRTNCNRTNRSDHSDYANYALHWALNLFTNTHIFDEIEIKPFMRSLKHRKSSGWCFSSWLTHLNIFYTKRLGTSNLPERKIILRFKYIINILKIS